MGGTLRFVTFHYQSTNRVSFYSIGLLSKQVGIMRRNCLAIAYGLVVLCSINPSSVRPQQNVSLLPEWLVFSRYPKVDIQILEPQGIHIWTKYDPKYLHFGVELYVNPNGYEVSCDVCRNISNPIDGKFLIHDNNVRVKLGDTIKYRVIHAETNEAEWSSWRTVFVDKHLFLQTTASCSIGCEHAEAHRKIMFLEGYLRNMIINCGSNSFSEHLVFPFQDAPNLVSDPVQFVKARLYSVDVLRSLSDRVASAYITQKGVGFTMRDTIDTLKVLELAGDQFGVVEYDKYMLGSAFRDSSVTRV
ncbi:uncharacterized protein LOC129777249 [Toxorhynchites rutilus septentrionalis]|uniref:uncharacterized protein LOC129777249 n=1 Tax=Toxorhynchites rutilus septentrionalis TaxID=329112 RepID=UPI0024786BF4|nr:uncharacterized protein LOC129777249 [Toxorhynchites rutilus septentrionalis]